jgi:hypothetical protein
MFSRKQTNNLQAMNEKTNFEKTFLTLLIGLIFLTGTFDAIAQENKTEKLKDFQIIIEKTDDGIKMQSVKGSAWIEVSFSLDKDLPQAVDEYGMAQLSNISKTKDQNIADYLFTIIKTDNGIELKGVEGTVWTELIFTLAKNKKQAIDQFGMTSLN